VPPDHLDATCSTQLLRLRFVLRVFASKIRGFAATKIRAKKKPAARKATGQMKENVFRFEDYGRPAQVS
jgi:hypothetical protein